MDEIVGGKLDRKFQEYVALGEEIDPEELVIGYYRVEGARGLLLSRCRSRNSR